MFPRINTPDYDVPSRIGIGTSGSEQSRQSARAELDEEFWPELPEVWGDMISSSASCIENCVCIPFVDMCASSILPKLSYYFSTL